MGCVASKQVAEAAGSQPVATDHDTGIVYYAFLDPTLPPRLSAPIHVALVLALALFTSLGVLATSLTSGLPLPLRALLV